jgi:hypothetical protein
MVCASGGALQRHRCAKQLREGFQLEFLGRIQGSDKPCQNLIRSDFEQSTRHRHGFRYGESHRALFHLAPGFVPGDYDDPCN